MNRLYKFLAFITLSLSISVLGGWTTSNLTIQDLGEKAADFTLDTTIPTSKFILDGNITVTLEALFIGNLVRYGSFIVQQNAESAKTLDLSLEKESGAAQSISAAVTTTAGESSIVYWAYYGTEGEYSILGVEDWPATTTASAGGDFSDGGDTAGANRVLGNNDAYDLGIETNGTTRLTVKSDGNVGIGTANPSAMLEIETVGTANIKLDAGNDVLLYMDKGSVSRKCEIVHQVAGVAKWLVGLPDSDTQGNGDEFFIGEITGGTDPSIWLEPGGNVGIGTTSPGANLDVNGSVSLNSSGGDNDLQYKGLTDDNLIYGDASADNVGFGISTPVAKVTINGAASTNDQKLFSITENGVETLTFECDLGTQNNPILLKSSTIDPIMTIQTSADRNIGIGTSNMNSSAVGCLAIANGTAPSSGTANMSYIYARDVSASSEMFTMDEAGNETPISPHDPLTNEWVFRSTNMDTGRHVRIEMEKFVKFIDEKFGTEFFQETFIKEDLK